MTKSQFLRVLDRLRINAPAHILQGLLKRYMDKGNIDEVNYVDFCEDIDSATQLFQVGQDINHSFDYFPKTQPRVSKAEIVRNAPEDTEDVISRIRTTCKQQRIRVSEFFRDFDRLRSGFITAAQFRIGLNMGKIPISNTEFNLLCEQYRAPKEGDHIRWKDFSDEVDEVFTKKGLEKNVDAPVGMVRTQTNYGRASATDEQCDNVNRIVGEFTEFVRKNRLDSKSFFQDFDKHRHFKVSQKVFRQVLNALGFVLSEKDVADVGVVYGNDIYEVKYADFLRDCNCLEYIVNGPTTGAKSTYVTKFNNFSGTSEMD